MIGDSAKDDVVSGNRAGCVTVLRDAEGRWRTEEGSQSREEETSSSSEVVRDNGVAVDDVLRGEMVPTFVVRSLAEVAPLLEKHFALRAGERARGFYFYGARRGILARDYSWRRRRTNSRGGE